MAYCRTQHEISIQNAEAAWINLQLDAHKSGCTLCYLIDEATQNGGILPLAIANELQIPVIEKDGNKWVGAESTRIIIYDGQQLLVG